MIYARRFRRVLLADPPYLLFLFMPSSTPIARSLGCVPPFTHAIPLPARLLHLFPQLHLGKADVHHYNGRACGVLTSHWDRWYKCILNRILSKVNS